VKKREGCLTFLWSARVEKGGTDRRDVYMDRSPLESFFGPYPFVVRRVDIRIIPEVPARKMDTKWLRTHNRRGRRSAGVNDLEERDKESWIAIFRSCLKSLKCVLVRFNGLIGCLIPKTSRRRSVFPRDANILLPLSETPFSRRWTTFGLFECKLKCTPFGSVQGDSKCLMPCGCAADKLALLCPKRRSSRLDLTLVQLSSTDLDSNHN
jgi:hypothetical protein